MKKEELNVRKYVSGKKYVLSKAERAMWKEIHDVVNDEWRSKTHEERKRIVETYLSGDKMVEEYCVYCGKDVETECIGSFCFCVFCGKAIDYVGNISVDELCLGYQREG